MRFELPDTIEAIEFYYEQGLTDGLPVVPPTSQQVQQFLDESGLNADDIIATKERRNWIITAQNVAINAVMAGCKREYMPIVLAAVEAYMEPSFNGTAIVESTGHATPMIIVNGPIRKTLNINSGWNLFGPGWRANATIGRALRLILMNVCRVRPGINDMSIFGQPGRYSSCIAEAEELTPWDPFHVEQGFPIGESTVTVVGANPLCLVSDQNSNRCEDVLDSIGTKLGELDEGFGQVVVIISPQHLNIIAATGITKKEVQINLLDRANDHRGRLIAEHGEQWILKTLGRSASVLDDTNSAAGRLGLSSQGTFAGLGPAEDIIVLVGGGGGAGYSAIVPLWSGGWATGRAITKPIRTSNLTKSN